MKLVCGRLPESAAELAPQPTVSQLEHSVSARDCYRIARALGVEDLDELARRRYHRGLLVRTANRDLNAPGGKST